MFFEEVISLVIKNILSSLMSVICLGSAARWFHVVVCLFVADRREDGGRGSKPRFPHETYSALPCTHTNTLAHTHALPPPVRRTHSPRPARPLPASRRCIVSQSRPPSLLLPQGSAQLFSTFPGGGGRRLERPTPEASAVLLAARQNPIIPHLCFINGTRAETEDKREKKS